MVRSDERPHEPMIDANRPLEAFDALAVPGLPAEGSVAVQQRSIAPRDRPDSGGAELERRSCQYDLLFAQYLRSSDNRAAATTMLHKALSLEDGRLEALERLVWLFQGSDDPAIQAIVLQGQLEQCRICPEHDAAFLPILLKYIDLAWQTIDPIVGIASLVLDAEDALGLDTPSGGAALLQTLLTGLGDSVSPVDRAAGKGRIARSLLDLQRFDACIRACGHLLMQIDEGETDCLHWNRQAHQTAGRLAVAEWFLIEVAGRLSGSPGDERLAAAKAALGSISLARRMRARALMARLIT